MNESDSISEATRRAIEAIGLHAQTQHELMKTIPMKPISMGRGHVSFEVTMPDLFSDGKTIHGGLFTILLDTILASAAWTRMDEFMPLATINLKTDYFSDTRPGDKITLEANCQSIANEVAFCQGTAFSDNGEPVAQADGTFMVGTVSATKGSRL